MMRRWLIVAVILVWCERAHAFGEDVCYTPGGGPLFNCLALPEACQPVETTTNACYSAVIASSAANAAASDGGRSLVHTDATYVLARAAGFSEVEAYWIAAYDEAIDLGSFTPRDMQGVTLDASWTTASVTGLVRTSFDTGGVLFHFLAPAVSGVDGLHPDVDNADEEIMLAHLRAWVTSKASGGEGLVCSAGLTVVSVDGDYASGGVCYEVADAPRSIHGQLAAVGDVPVSFTIDTGLQIITSATDDTVAALSDQFDEIVGGEAERPFDASLGIYLHAIADRISHHVCTDASLTVGPTAGIIAFEVDMTNAECVQSRHLLRHMWETGVDFEALEPADRTTRAALALVYSELVAFATVRGIADPRTTDVAYGDTLVTVLGDALETEDVTARITAIADIACSYGWASFKGTPECPSAPAAPTDPTTDASTEPTTDATSDNAATVDVEDDQDDQDDQDDDDGGCSQLPNDGLIAAALAVFLTKIICMRARSRLRASPSRNSATEQ